MGQSLVSNYMHIVFSTKHREPLIDAAIENDLYAYLHGICEEMECYSLRIGGAEDHIHILCMLSKKVALAKLLAILKANSSKWIKIQNEKYAHFYWQDGYGAFSVNPTEIHKVIEYIARQKEHHAHKTFQVEFRAFLEKYNIAYDERYVWD